jgi:hypothetical protein
VGLGAAGTGCGGTSVSLGDARPPLYHFGKPRLVSELDASFPNENPTLTGDLLELWFNSNRTPNPTTNTNGDVWFARRASAQVPFGAPERVDAVSSPMHETSPAISRDGLTIYFASDRDGGLGDFDVWSATRVTRTAAWSAPIDVASLNSITRDLPRPPGLHDLVMPLSSQRDDVLNYQTFFSTRASVNAAFAPPVAIPELTFADRTAVDDFLTDDGLAMFYSSAPTGVKLDIFVAWRKTTSEPFSVAVPISLDTGDDERDPWLSPDGSVFYFTSDRGGGVLQIYEAAASRGLSAGR